MSQPFIFDTPRTPRGKGKPDGALHVLRPVDLLAGLMMDLVSETGLDTGRVDDVVMGCVSQTGEQGADIARFAALTAGWDQGAPGVTLNRFCGSGLEAVNHAACMVGSGYFDLVVAGGVESMSRVKMGSDGGAMFDPQTQWDVGSVPQGISADLLATLHGVSRGEIDAWAAESQRRAAAAEEAGRFTSRRPVKDAAGLTLLDRDEHMRPGTTADKLGKLPASFATLGEGFGFDVLTRRAYPQLERIHHVHTAGNSSGIVDGAALVVVGSEAVGKAQGLRPRARVRAMALAGTEPVAMLTGPMPASRKALEKAGMTAADIDLFEVNEAFGVVPILFCRELGVDPAKVNVDGGAIALGHPLGATGAMLLGTALDALEARNLQTALVTLCIGGGMGIATIVERV